MQVSCWNQFYEPGFSDQEIKCWQPTILIMTTLQCRLVYFWRRSRKEAHYFCRSKAKAKVLSLSFVALHLNFLNFSRWTADRRPSKIICPNESFHSSSSYPSFLLLHGSSLCIFVDLRDFWFSHFPGVLWGRANIKSTSTAPHRKKKNTSKQGKKMVGRMFSAGNNCIYM